MIIIGIAGASGSGKSLFCKNLLARVREECSHLSIDSISEDAYYLCQNDLTLDERNLVNYDHPDALEHTLLVAQLDQLKKGQGVAVPLYDFSVHNRKDESRNVEPCDVLVLEGILILHDPEIRKRLDLAIYVDVDLESCFCRRMRRDIVKRGRSPESVIDQLENSVRPMFYEFVLPSKQNADFCVLHGGENRKAVELVARYVSKSRP